MPTDDEFFTRIFNSIDRCIEFLALTAGMLYPSPKDIEDRREYLYKALISYLAEQARYASSVGLNPMETNKALIYLFSSAQAAIGGLVDLDKYLLIQRKEDFRQAFNDRLCKGILTGLVLNTALGKRISLNEAIKQCVNVEQQAEHVKPDGEFKACGFSMKFTEDNFTKNIWPVFKDIAHLWAALSHFKYKDSPYVPLVFIDFDQIEVDCLPPPLQGKKFVSNYDLFKFLAYTYWGNAIAYKPPKSSTTLMNEKGPYNPLDVFGFISDPMTS